MSKVDIIIGKIGWRTDLPIEIKQEYFRLKGITYNIYEEVYAFRDNSKNSTVSIIGFKKYPIGLINSKDINGFEIFDDLGDFLDLFDERLKGISSEDNKNKVNVIFESVANNDPFLIQAIKNVDFKDKNTENAIVSLISVQESVLHRCKIYHLNDREYLAESHLECVLESTTDDDGTIVQHTNLVNKGFPLILEEEKNN